MFLAGAPRQILQLFSEESGESVGSGKIKEGEETREKTTEKIKKNIYVFIYFCLTNSEL